MAVSALHSDAGSLSGLREQRFWVGVVHSSALGCGGYQASCTSNEVDPGSVVCGMSMTALYKSPSCVSRFCSSTMSSTAGHHSQTSSVIDPLKASTKLRHDVRFLPNNPPARLCRRTRACTLLIETRNAAEAAGQRQKRKSGRCSGEERDILRPRTEWSTAACTGRAGGWVDRWWMDVCIPV